MAQKLVIDIRIWDSEEQITFESLKKDEKLNTMELISTMV